MRDGIRLRQRPSGRFVDDVPYTSQASLGKKRISPIGTWYLLVALTFFLAVSLIIIVAEKNLPEARLVKTEDLHPGKFVAERAREHLVNLTSIGPRITGSYENEVLAIEYLTTLIRNIIKGANENYRVAVDVTKHTGAFPLTFLDGMTNVYRNVQNIIVKLGPQRSTKRSLLLNCHFDTFPDSPGGSDDGAGCAVMLEILRVMSHGEAFLKHDIIFLFNGAEENLMQASHGFITQHPWAKEVRAFINLEACGAGGRELLFQAGPNDPWILEVYSETVPYPYASSLAQEIFQSGIVPGDTDFRIFRDFGEVSGLDFAWSTNGYVYHTKFDTVDQIPLGTLQRTGDNILALARGISAGRYLTDAPIPSPVGSLVFFDFLGAFVIRWPQYLASTINLIGILLGAYSIYLNMKAARRGIGVRNSIYAKQLAICVATVVGSWLVTIVSVTSIALIFTELGKVMSWYARPAWLFFLYICPAVSVSMTLFLYVATHQRKEIHSPWTLYQLYCDAYGIIWMSFLFLCVVLEIRSGFIPLHWVLFAAAGNVLRDGVFDKWRDWKWLSYQLGILSLPYVQSFYLAIGAIYLFIPIMGRAGAGINSEVIMANMISLLSCLLLSFTLPIVLLVRNAARVICLLVGIFFIATSILILTPLGFPYSGDTLAPAPARFMIAHTQRQYHHANGTLRYSGTGFWIVDLDMNSPHSVGELVPEVGAATFTARDCEEELYCGLPYLMPVTTFLWKTSWIPGPAPSISVPTKLELISKVARANVISFTFNVTGPDHIGIMLSPYPGVRLHKWSVLNGEPLKGPLWKSRDTYFIYYSCASDCTPYNFSLDLTAPTGHSGSSLTIAVAGHFLHGTNQRGSLSFTKFLAQFPQWAVVTPWTASYKSWEF